jgi:hypothetical protein
MLRGGWKSFGWTFGILAAFAVTLGAGLLSGSFTWGHYFDSGHLLALGEGELELWLLMDPCGDDLGLEDVFAGYYFPRPWPAEGLMRNRAFDLCWRWPAICTESHRGVGIWWEVRLPLWTVAASILALGVARRVRAAYRRRGPDERPGWSTAGRVALALSVAASTLVAGAWFTSVSYYLGLDDGVHAVMIDHCALVLSKVDFLDGTASDAELDAEPDDDSDAGWDCRVGPQVPARWCWEPPYYEESTIACGETWSAVVLPFWALLPITATPGVLLLWRHRRRRRPGHCHECDYDLTGNVSGRCPECGTSVVTA